MRPNNDQTTNFVKKYEETNEEFRAQNEGKSKSKEEVTNMHQLQHTNKILISETWILYFSNDQTEKFVIKI